MYKKKKTKKKNAYSDQIKQLCFLLFGFYM